MSVIAVTGMQREANCFPPGCEIVLSGGGGNAGLADKIEAAIARGRRAILSAGLCGGLQPGLAVGTAIIATHVAHGSATYQTDAAWTAALRVQISGAVSGLLAGSDQIASSPAAKDALYAATGALAVDLESHIAGELAAKHGLPFAVLRVVSDAAEDALPPAALVAMNAAGRINIRALARSLLRNPGQIPALIQTGRNAEIAFAELLRGFRVLGPSLGQFDLG